MIANILETSVSSALVCSDSKTGAQAWKPLSRKAFALTAAGCNLKGRELKKAHWAYLEQASAELGAAVTHEIAAGRIRITGANANAKGHGGALKWETAERFARHEPAASKKEDPYALLAAKLGISVEALKAKVSA